MSDHYHLNQEDRDRINEMLAPASGEIPPDMTALLFRHQGLLAFVSTITGIPLDDVTLLEYADLLNLASKANFLVVTTSDIAGLILKPDAPDIFVQPQLIVRARQARVVLDEAITVATLLIAEAKGID